MEHTEAQTYSSYHCIKPDLCDSVPYKFENNNSSSRQYGAVTTVHTICNKADIFWYTHQVWILSILITLALSIVCCLIYVCIRAKPDKKQDFKALAQSTL